MRVSRTATASLSAALMASVLGGAAMAQSPAASMAAPAGSMGAPAVATPGEDVKMMSLPKFLGISVFTRRIAAHRKQPLRSRTRHPSLHRADPGQPAANQIDTMTNAPAEGYKVVTMSNNTGEQPLPPPRPRRRPAPRS